jgi:kexin
MDTRRCGFRVLGVVAAAALAACGGADDPAAAHDAHSARSARPLAAAVAAAPLGAGAAAEVNMPIAASSYDPSRPDQVTVGTIALDGFRYNDVVATFSGLVGVGNGVATRTYDSFDPATGQLTVASVTVGDTTYTDVVLAISGVLSVGSAGPLTEVIPNDPLFADQWHLRNTGQAGQDGAAAKAGEDLNVTMAWNHATGTGIRIAVIDDGIDVDHEDLNVVAGKSWDYRINAYGDPSSETSSHGTSCAGLAAARGHNGIGVTGVAFNARVVGYNLLAATTGDFGADAVVKDLADNQVYSNSYGSADSNGLVAPSEQAWRDAIDTGTRTGRGGRGAVYTWAAGNGAPEDRSDYDGQANYQGVLAVGALNSQGRRASYSEPGANVLVMGFGGEFCDSQQTTSTDVSGDGGYNNGATAKDADSPYNDYTGSPNYTRCFNGTSAATPQVSGVVALMLEVNRSLGWRDVRAILAKTARKTDPDHEDWQTNGAGLRVNHNYGFGAADATAALAAARTWQNLPAQRTAQSAPASGGAVADAGPALVRTLALAGSGISKLEFVDLTIDSDHADIGELEITLTSPSGTVSTVSAARQCQDEQKNPVTCGAGLAGGFRFGIVRLMDEVADGSWTLSMRDTREGNAGTLKDWSIKVYGH